MAQFYGVNATRINANKKAGVGEVNGYKSVIYEEIKIPQAVLAISDVIDIGAKIPKGARVLECNVKCASTGTTGIFKIGYKASEEATPLEAGDDDAFGSGYDTGGQAVQENNKAGDGIGKKFLSSVQPQITMTEATDAGTNVVLQVWLTFILD